MTDEERAEANATDCEHSTAGFARDATLQAVPTLSAAATQLSFAAAVNQLNALARFGAAGGDGVSPECRARATELRVREYESRFIRDRVIEINANGLVPGIIEYLRAAEAIQAKAAALGYGAQSQTVPITSVPGGYVGRFGGHDIYAAAR